MGCAKLLLVSTEAKEVSQPMFLQLQKYYVSKTNNAVNVAMEHILLSNPYQILVVHFEGPGDPRTLNKVTVSWCTLLVLSQSATQAQSYRGRMRGEYSP